MRYMLWGIRDLPPPKQNAAPNTQTKPEIEAPQTAPTDNQAVVDKIAAQAIEAANSEKV